MIERVREFICDLDVGRDGAEELLTEVVAAQGELILARGNPAAGPCQFDLVHRSPSAGDTVLSGSAGGFLFAVAQAAPGGERLVCASRIWHDEDAEAEGNTDTLVRRVTSNVTIDCAAHDGSAWSPLAAAIDPQGDWAAWVSKIELVSAAPATFRITYVRDFSFQFLNLLDAGRPDTDGIYQTLIVLDGGRAGFSVGSTEKLSDTIVEAHVQDDSPDCPPGLIDPSDPACVAPAALPPSP